MNSFFLDEFTVTHINLCMLVKGTNRKQVHRNRPYHGLVLITKGCNRYVFDDGRVLRVQAGEVFYLPKYSTYRVEPEGFGECIAVNFDLSPDKSYPPFSLPTEHRMQYQDTFELLLRAWNENTLGHRNRCYLHLYTLLCSLQRERLHRYISTKSRSFALQGMEYLSERLSDSKLTVEEVSKHLKITPEYFRKLFKAVFGLSPRRYILQLRMERAKNFLQSHEYTVAEICYLCGYEDESYFCKEFKRFTGQTPMQFARLQG